MKTSFGPTLIVLLILYCGCAIAQTDTGTGDTGAPTQPGPTPAFTYPDATPSLDFLNGAVENSSITLGIGAGITFNDYTSNAITGSNQQSWLFHVAPNIKIQQFRPRLSWNVSYSGGWQTYTNPTSSSNSNYNLFSQNASAGILWQMAKHWQLNATDHFTYSADPFGSFIAQAGAPTINNPNPVTYYPLTQYTINSGLMSLTDQLSKVDTLAFTGTANLRRTSTYNLLSSVPFYNLVSYGGRASYAHQLSPRLTLGADYNYNSLDFGRGQQHSGVQTIQMTVDYLLRPNMSISGWVGPEHTGTQDTILGVKLPHSSLWSTSAGANFGWQSVRNSFRAGYTRQVLDGGGIIGTSQVNSLNASYHRSLASRVDALVGLAYFHDASITISRRTYDHFYINAVLTYKFTKSLTANAQYAYLRQDYPVGILVGNTNYNSNLIGASINYTWSHPLGR